MNVPLSARVQFDFCANPSVKTLCWTPSESRLKGHPDDPHKISSCSLQKFQRLLAASAAQIAWTASSSPRPFGTVGLPWLAKYHRVSAEVAVRLPGISR